MAALQKVSIGMISQASRNGPSRRKLLHITALGLISERLASVFSGRTSAHAAEDTAGKLLIAYFSRTGNTREVANLIRQRIGGDIIEVKTLRSYPDQYRATTEQAKREQEANYRPEITPEIKNIDQYNAVLIGYPNWWGTMPMALFTFLEKYDFANKALIPFCTHEGSRLGRSVSDIQAVCPHSTVLKGLALRGGDSGYVKTESAHREVAEWLLGLGVGA
jgi:flavodoxin